MASHPVATASDGKKFEGHVLRLGLDLGTGHMSIDGQHIQGDFACDPSPLYPQGWMGEPSVKRIAILKDGGNIIYGTQNVHDAVRARPTLHDKAMERFKLALYSEFAHLSDVQHVKDILGTEDDRGAMEDLFAALFRELFKDAKATFLNPFLNAGMDESYWNTIPLELQISVPAMWDEDARGVIRNAAKHAGAWRTELREEPLCIATVHMVAAVRRRNIKAGQRLLLIDCGRGTLDIAIVKLISEPVPSEGKFMELERDGSCSGSSAGSHTVNTAAEEWLLAGGYKRLRPNEFKDKCRRLGLTRRQFLRSFSDEIDRLKQDREKEVSEVFHVTIRCGDAVAGHDALYQEMIPIPRATVEEWYAAWLDPATELLERHLSNQSGEFLCAILSGGGAKSGQFCTQMKTVLDTHNIPIGPPVSCASACSSGALLQHFFQEDKLPPNAYFYINTTEYYNKDFHTDAKNNRSLIFPSKYDTTQKLVFNRLLRAMEISEKRGIVSGGYIEQLFYLPARGKPARIHVDLFWSSKKISEHQPLNSGPQGTRRGDARPYPLMFMDRDNFEGDEFQIFQDRDDDGDDGGDDENNGEPHFLVKGYVKMEGTTESLVLKVYLMKHYYEFPPYDPDVQPFEDDDVLAQHEDEVWHKDCSHFVSSSSGVAKGPARSREGFQAPGSRSDG